MTISATEIEQALKDLTALKPGDVAEAIKNPADLQNTLGIVLKILTVASIFIPQVAVAEDIIEVLADFIPLIEAGNIAFHWGLHAPTGDPDPTHDAQLSHGGGDLT